MKLRDFCNAFEKEVPKELKESFDNVGLMIGEYNKEIKRVLVSLDCTKDSIKEAKEKGCDLIFTHHPLLFMKPSSITSDSLQGEKILDIIKSDLAVYSAHTNLDSVKDGINDSLLKILGFHSKGIMDSKTYRNEEYGIGRFVELSNSLKLHDILNILKQNLNLKFIRFSGALESSIDKIAIINGSGSDFFQKAKSMGAQCIITGDTTYHYVSDFNEMNINIIDAGHFSTEWKAFKVAFEGIIDKAFKDSHIEFIFSETSKDPYEVF